MLEVNAVLWGKVDFRDGHQFSFDLAGAPGETELAHVFQAWRLAPPRVADQVLGVQRSAAGLAGRRPWLVLGVAPPALDQFHGLTIEVVGRDKPVWLPLW